MKQYPQTAGFVGLAVCLLILAPACVGISQVVQKIYKK